MDQIINAFATIIITQLIKLNKRIPAISVGMKKNLRIVVGVLAVLSTGLTHYLDGTLQLFIQSPDFKSGLAIAIEAAVVFLGSHLGYKGMKALKM